MSFRRTAPRVIFAIFAVLAIVVILFDWNWVRRPVERYLTDKSGRQVTLGDLHVKVGFSLEPTVRLRGVYVENASWSAKRPLIAAAEVTFTVSLKSLWDGRAVVSRLVLVDADVHMERRADGLRNWRLLHPEERGPGKVRVLTLQAHQSKLRFINHGAELDLFAAASDTDARKATVGDDALVSRIIFKGTYHGAAFAGDTLAGRVLTFRDTGRAFPVRGHMTSGKTRIDVDGLLTDVYDLGPMDAQLRVAGATLSQLHPFLKIRPPPSRPFVFEGRLVQANNEYKFSGLKGRIGKTDLAGDAIYDRRPERPLVRATLRSETADLTDIGPLLGFRGQIGEDKKDEPARPFRSDALRGINARLTMHAARLRTPQAPILESLRVSADLTDGVLELKPIEVGVAGGHVSGSFTFNASGPTPSARAALEIRSLQLEKLMPALSKKTRSAGAINGHVKFAGHGNSMAAMVGSAMGSFAARMAGGRISNLSDAKLGLNWGKALGLMVRGDRDIAIYCGAVAFDFNKGIGKSRAIRLDTEQTHVSGAGTIDLRASSLDLLVTPQPKKPGLLTRPASIRIHGRFGELQKSVEERVSPSSYAKSRTSASASTCSG